MADINFSFGTTELEGLRDLLRDLQKAIESIYKTALASGVAVQDDDQRAKAYLSTMTKIEAEIKRQESAANKLNEVNKLSSGIIGGLEKQVRDLTREWKSATDAASQKRLKDDLDLVKRKLSEAKDSTNSWGRALDSFQFKFNALGNIAANVMSSVKGYMVDFIKDSIRMAAETEGVRRAFDNLNKQGMLDELRKATRGAVSDLSLMKSAVLASNFKIPLDQLATFLKFAGDRAISTGQDFDYLVESIIRGLGRESVLVLDNLGLSAKELQDEAKKTGDFFTGAANVISREMKSAGDVIDTTATQFARFNAAIANLKVETGKNLAPGMADAAGGLSKFIQKLNEASISLIDVLLPSQLFYKSIGGYQRNLQNAAKGVSELSEESNMNGLVIAKETVTIKSLQDEIGKLNQIKEQTDVTDTQEILRLNVLISKYEDQIKKLNDLGKSVKNAKAQKLTEINPVKDIEVSMSGLPDILDLFAPEPKTLDERLAESTARVRAWIAQQDDLWFQSNQRQTEQDEEKKRIRNMMFEQGYRTASAFGDLLTAHNTANMEKELAQQGLTEEQKLQIKKKYARKDQNIAVAMALINTAEAVTKVFSEVPPPASFYMAALIAAEGALNVAAIKSQKFAKGGEIGGRPHSQGGTVIEAERGEYVINKKAYAKNKELVHAINAEDSLRIALAMNQDRKIEKPKVDYNKLTFELLKNQERGWETPEFYVIQKGNSKILLKKK